VFLLAPAGDFLPHCTGERPKREFGGRMPARAALDRRSTGDDSRSWARMVANPPAPSDRGSRWIEFSLPPTSFNGEGRIPPRPSRLAPGCAAERSERAARRPPFRGRFRRNDPPFRTFRSRNRPKTKFSPAWQTGEREQLGLGGDSAGEFPWPRSPGLLPKRLIVWFPFPWAPAPYFSSASLAALALYQAAHVVGVWLRGYAEPLGGVCAGN